MIDPKSAPPYTDAADARGEWSREPIRNMAVGKMNERTRRIRLFAFLCASVSLTACVHGTVAAQSVADEALRQRVAAALENASDVPADSLTVEVSGGVVTLSGSVACEACAGSRTPPGAATVQQSLGAVVRAIPGVERVEFELQYRPPAERSDGRGG